ncbi:MAG TPA: hypothetical protein VK742_20430 [Candidatus Sulfotelmatobacter sp.]|jgi:hypothetical protein|nr:hypothetical protein [Candidatus Sulfotelmatobacter sp.]
MKTELFILAALLLSVVATSLFIRWKNRQASKSHYVRHWYKTPFREVYSQTFRLWLASVINCHIVRRLERPTIAASLGCLLVATLLLLAPPASAQGIGTYVNTRPVTLFSGWVTNGQALVPNSVFTNFLNYSGFHRIGLWASTTFTNPVNVAGSNVSLQFDFGPGQGNGYSNSVFGTNYPFTTTEPLQWFLPINTNAMLLTNIDWNFSDSVQFWRFTQETNSTSGGHNGFYLQLDATVTP